MTRALSAPRRPSLAWPMALLMVALLASLAAAMSLGSVPVPLASAAGIVLERLVPGSIAPTWSAVDARIVWDIRVPRALLGAVVGAGLAVVGAALQSITRNPLADPYLFGASSGAALGAVVVIVLLGGFLGPATLPAMTFGGAMVALLLVLIVAGRGAGPERLVLAGVAVSFVFFAATNMVIFAGDQRAAHSVMFWTMGGLGFARWSQIGVPVTAILAGTAVLLLYGRTLNALATGDETATSLGITVARTRLGLFAACAVVTGAAVAVSGAIGFVGLMVPHAVRGLVGADARRVLPVAALLGAVFLTWVDIVARLALAPQELPVGMVTAALGGVFFVWFMARRQV